MWAEEIGIIESVKSVSNIIAPITGTVIEVNEQLSDQPDLVNQSPHDEGEEVNLFHSTNTTTLLRLDL